MSKLFAILLAAFSTGLLSGDVKQQYFVELQYWREGYRNMPVLPIPVTTAVHNYLSSKLGEHLHRFDLTLRRCRFEVGHFPGPSLHEGERKALFELTYRLCDPERPFVDFEVAFYVSDDGEAFMVGGWVDVPDCVAHPFECDFPIDQDGAARIAEERGFAVGPSSSEPEFRWGLTCESFVWEIRNIDRERGWRKVEVLWIDANTGYECGRATYRTSE